MKERLDKRINVRVPESEKKALVKVCDVLQIEQSDVVREAVKKELSAFAKLNPQVREILQTSTTV